MSEDRFDCHECGVGVGVDEDGCCRGCGADAEQWRVDRERGGQLLDDADGYVRKLMAANAELRERCKSLEEWQTTSDEYEQAMDVSSSLAAEAMCQQADIRNERDELRGRCEVLEVELDKESVSLRRVLRREAATINRMNKHAAAESAALEELAEARGLLVDMNYALKERIGLLRRMGGVGSELPDAFARRLREALGEPSA